MSWLIYNPPRLDKNANLKSVYEEARTIYNPPRLDKNL